MNTVRHKKSSYIKPQDSSFGRTANLVVIVFFTAVVILALLPIALVFAASLSSEESIELYGFSYIPKEFSLDAFSYLFGSGDTLPRAVLNSLIITAAGTVLGLVIMCPCAYALSRKEFRWGKLLTVFLLIPMLFSGGLVSSYMVNTQILHLKNTYLALILPGMCSTWYLMILRNYFRTNIPDSLIEAGKLEGVSPLRSLVSIVLPICRPVVMTVAVFQIFGYWNSWYPALIYIDSNHSELYPLQYVLVNIERTVQAMTRDAANITGMENVTVPGMTMRMALVVVTVVPIIILFPFFQRFLKTGMTIGAVKE
ncbi:MAG: carbohydrate ABC transporter permease [Ruminiclostridium sp.]|nr:carbohydrate ABC transporter permease [Ruminiclostridium sp.]